VGVREPGRDLDLAQEPRGAHGRLQLRLQDLDRDGTAVPQVFGEIDVGHAAVSELALDTVAARQRRGEMRQLIRHGTGSSAGVILPSHPG
jgi:hypothetical protein